MSFGKGNIGKAGEKVGGINPTAQWFANLIQEKNFETAMKTQIIYMQEVQKVKPEHWDNMRKTMSQLNTFSRLGGFENLIGGTVSRLKQNLSLSLESATLPITNALNQIVDNIMGSEGFKQAITDVTETIQLLINTFLGDTGLLQLIEQGAGFLAETIQTLGDLEVWKDFQDILDDLNIESKSALSYLNDIIQLIKGDYGEDSGTSGGENVTTYSPPHFVSASDTPSVATTPTYWSDTTSYWVGYNNSI